VASADAPCWDPVFETVLRSFLPRLPADLVLDPDLPLPAYGMDSIGMVAVIASLEAEYDVVFPDHALVPDTFGTTGSVWAVVSDLLAARPA
jgi:acyl carrier protein